MMSMLRRKTLISNPTKSFAEEEALEAAPKVSMKSAIVKYFQKNEFLHDNKKLTTEKEDQEECTIRRILKELEAKEEEETIQRNANANKHNSSRRASANWRKANMMVSTVSTLQKPKKCTATERTNDISDDEDEEEKEDCGDDDIYQDADDLEFANAFLDNEWWKGRVWRKKVWYVRGVVIKIFMAVYFNLFILYLLNSFYYSSSFLPRIISGLWLILPQ